MTTLLEKKRSDSRFSQSTIRQMANETYSKLQDVLELLPENYALTSEPDMQRGTCKSPSLNDAQFLKWQSLLEQRTGMYINIYHRSLLETNLIIRMREVECSDFDEYYAKVSSKPDGIVEWSILLDRLMVQETRFYRNPESLSLFTKHISEILKTNALKNEARSLNIWSVGCSSGEEPYTLAILCQELMKAKNSAVSFGITATDISLPVLTKAREGIYNARRLLDLKSELIDQYFNPLDSNKFQVIDSLKKKVCFSMANLIDIEKSPLKNMDIIYCQNVLIYFRKECKHIILDSLVERLSPGGLLVIGQGEALGWYNDRVTRVPDNQTLAYIRRNTQEH